MTSDASFQWHEPTQARSREKVERMLDAAVDLAVERGSLDIKVTEVAKRAGVAIGTLYQFFPTRTALIAKLFAREMEPIDALVANALIGFGSRSEIRTGIEREIRATLDLVRSRPGLLVIWSSLAIDPVVEAADFANTRQNAQTLTDRLKSVVPSQVEQRDLFATALLICHLWGSVVRLCVLADDGEEDAIISQYSNMLSAHTASLFSKTD